MSNSQLTHNGQPVNLDAILDFAARVVRAKKWRDKQQLTHNQLAIAQSNCFVDIVNALKNVCDNDQAFLEARLEGG